MTTICRSQTASSGAICPIKPIAHGCCNLQSLVPQAYVPNAPTTQRTPHKMRRDQPHISWSQDARSGLGCVHHEGCPKMPLCPPFLKESLMSPMAYKTSTCRSKHEPVLVPRAWDSCLAAPSSWPTAPERHGLQLRTGPAPNASTYEAHEPRFPRPTLAPIHRRT